MSDQLRASGKTVSRRHFIKTAAAGAGMLAAGGLPVLAASQPMKPNIVLLFTDEHRTDALGYAGNRFISTPHLDGLAASGVRFTNTYCQGPLCQPSRASLIFGQHVRDHGIVWNEMNMDPNRPNMMKQLQEAGYTTAVVGKTHFYHKPPSGSLDMRQTANFVRSFGFDFAAESFDTQVHMYPRLITAYKEYLQGKGLLKTFLKEMQPIVRSRESYFDGVTSEIPAEDSRINHTARQALSWLKSYDRSQPYFLWVSFVEPHPPYVDFHPIADQYREAAIPVGFLDPPDMPNNAWGRYLAALAQWGMLRTRSEADVRETARHYYGSITQVDQQMGEIIRLVEERGEADRTWFLFTSDHGEMLGQHSLWSKLVFYGPSVKVPGLIRPPRGVPPKEIKAPVQSVDLTATILEIAGAKPLPGATGRSLLPVMEGQGPEPGAAFSELAGPRGQGFYFVMVATPEYRYLYDRQSGTACELYDLKNDPLEQRNRLGDPAFASIQKALHGDLVEPFMRGKKA